MRLQDLFNAHSARYRRVRPACPESWFAWLAQAAPARERVWDAGTGPGTVACALAPRFAEVFATDISAGALEAAPPVRNVHWAIEPAERSSLATSTVDLVTAGAAFHWFDQPRFLREARRVLRPGGVIAVWAYTDRPEDSELATLLDQHLAPLDAHRAPELRLALDGYQDLDLGGTPIPAPPFTLTSLLDYEGTLDLVRSWSAAIRYEQHTQLDAAQLVAQPLAAFWTQRVGPRDRPMHLSWAGTARVERFGSRPAP